jgi:DNA-binding transcriptional regulator LsrR (DeoR family)
MEAIGYIGEQELESLRNADVVGDINSCFIRADGTIAPNTINERVIGLNTEDLRNIPKVIAIVQGVHKVEGLLANLRGGYIDTLITDEETAIGLVKQMSKT